MKRVWPDRRLAGIGHVAVDRALDQLAAGVWRRDDRQSDHQTPLGTETQGLHFRLPISAISIHPVVSSEAPTGARTTGTTWLRRESCPRATRPRDFRRKSSK